ncbi:hypothetical protein [Parabacteroides gordonii]|uniref:hypothetical protein n=1 Tax=Parabacteroides gordonii TaxID=574930 RepID=UPI000EE963D0|nr:hypothetical protein [Parabacteroides gordonii]RGP09264.1 hypothetical protein DXB27_23615 [Parabacteroides gordonii]
MSMQLRYRGGFYSLNQTLYDIEIWQEGFSGQVKDIAFCDSPLDIEWAKEDKLEPVQSSNATLQLYSDNDRQFVDLYTIEAGSVRMDIYRSKSLYWSGTLDPELYEEPFAYHSDYGVTLTFADMAVLERLKWERVGFMTLREVLVFILSKTGIRYKSINEHISTKLSQYSTENILDAVSVNLSNFFDEDGEPMSCREVLDETLRPFGVRLQQKNGMLFICDLNSIYNEFNPVTINWDSDDSTLGVDKVYNNVKLTFSPYEKTSILNGEIDPKTVGEERKLTTRVYTESTSTEIGFYTYLSDKGEGIEKSEKAKFFKIEPVFSGAEEAGVAWTVQTTNGPGTDYRSYVQPATSTIGSMLFKVPEKPYLTYIGYNRKEYKLKLNLSLLFDVRYNPFEEAQVQNEEGNWDRLKNWCNFAYVPFLLTLRDAEGNAIYHWQNKGVKESNSFARKDCRWVAGEGTWGDAWMCWYQGNRKNETGLGGWQLNKQIIGYYRGEKLPLLFDKMDQAEYIDMPDKPGYLELQIGVGVPCYDYGDKNNWKLRDDINERVRWVLYKDPKITVVDKNSNSLKSEDIEHTAWINKSAKEVLKIDTVLGTLKEPSPAALGQLFLSSNKSVINTFYRAGITDQIERLLIGTIYSNYATRHNTISGTTALLPSFEVYTDKHEPGKYLLLSETQHLDTDESEILMAQFDADNYKGVEFDE